VCKRLTFLISVVLVLALGGMASAAGVICSDSILNDETVTVEAGETWTVDCSSCGAGLCRMYIGEQLSGSGHLVVNGGTVSITGGTNFDDGRVCVEHNSDITVNSGEVYIRAAGGGFYFPDANVVGEKPAIYVYDGRVTLDEDRIDSHCSRDGNVYVGCGTFRMRSTALDWCGGTHILAVPGNEPVKYLGLDDEGYNVWTGSCGGGCSCLGDANEDGQIDLDDLQAIAGMLLDAGSPFIVVDPPACADITGDGQADLDDLQAVAGILLDAGSPFIVSCGGGGYGGS